MKRIFKIILFTISSSLVLAVSSLSIYCYFCIKSITKSELNSVLERSYSTIYDISNREIETLGVNKKEYVRYEDIPLDLINALISIEDSEFFYHDGINIKRIFSSLLNNVVSSSTQGGSTLTQQLVKNLLLNNEQSLSRKIKEGYLALEIEKKLTKEEILELYFNEVYFEHTIPGVGYASKRFFNKEVKHLNLVECSLLAGVVKSPTIYSPHKHIDNAEKRKNIVLKAMLDNNLITKERYDIARNKHVKDIIVEKGSNQKEETYDYQAYLDIVYKEVEELTGYNPFTYNLEIYTYLDTSIQSYLDKIQKEEIFKFSDSHQQIASCFLKNNDASIIGVIGGRNYDGFMLFNRAYDMLKQPASTLKPIFTYALAMEHLNYHEYSLVEDKPYTYPGTSTTVQNADKNYLGTIPLVDAIGYSRNTSTLYTIEKVINKIGIDNVIKYLKDIGIMDKGVFSMPYAIGGMTYGTNPIKLAASYSMLARGGTYINPSTIRSIKNKDTGEVIYTREINKKRVLSIESSYLISSTLKKVMDKNYYNIAYAKPSNIEVYAKTGTNAYDDKVIKSYNYPYYADSDVWFSGYSKNYSIASWTGFDRPIKNENTYFGRNDNRRLIVKDIFREGLRKLELKNEIISSPDTLTKVPIVKGVNGNYLPNELIPNNFIVYASFKKDMIPNTILPLPSFKEIEDVNIILTNDLLQLQIHHLLENDELYLPIFGEKVYMITYEDESSSNTYITTESTILLPYNKKSFTINIVETFKNNNKLTSKPLEVKYDETTFS